MNVFSSVGAILSFAFVLSSYYADKSENEEINLQNQQVIVGDFLSSYEQNKKSISHFFLTKAPGHNPDNSNILDYSNFFFLETTQFDRILTSGLIQQRNLFDKLIYLSGSVKKYNNDLMQVRELSYPLLGKNIIERTNLLILIERNANDILEKYNEVNKEIKKITKKSSNK